jgi:hypothetical protein
MRLFALSLFRSPQSGEGKFVRYLRMANASVLIVELFPTAAFALLEVPHFLPHRLAADLVACEAAPEG